jgi:L-amino acid N-acyltransferase YncA
LRFFTTVKDDFLDQAAARFSKADTDDTVSLVATTGSPERIVAHAMYAKTRRDRAEVAFAVARSWREHGLGTLLLRKLAQIASSQGVRVFEAAVLPENNLMMAMFRDCGAPLRIQAGGREMQVEFPTDPSQGT